MPYKQTLSQRETIHTMVPIKRDDEWRFTAFQNRPAKFMGRPELARQSIKEFRQVL